MYVCAYSLKFVCSNVQVYTVRPVAIQPTVCPYSPSQVQSIPACSALQVEPNTKMRPASTKRSRNTVSQHTMILNRDFGLRCFQLLGESVGIE